MCGVWGVLRGVSWVCTVCTCSVWGVCICHMRVDSVCIVLCTVYVVCMACVVSVCRIVMCAYVACVYSVTCSVWPSPQHLTSTRRTRRTSRPRPAWQGAAGCLSLSWSRGPPTRSAGAPASALASDARGPGFRGWPRSRVCSGLWQLPAQTHVHTLTRVEK